MHGTGHDLTKYGISMDVSATDDRRLWALDQLSALCRNGTLPRTEEGIKSILDFLLVHGFFVVRKVDMKSDVVAVN